MRSNLTIPNEPPVSWTRRSTTDLMATCRKVESLTDRLRTSGHVSMATTGESIAALLRSEIRRRDVPITDAEIEAELAQDARERDAYVSEAAVVAVPGVDVHALAELEVM